MVSADYIVGLTDGEGCFYFFRRIRYRAVPSKETSKLFVEVARLVQQGVHHTQDGIRQIQYLKSQMNHRTRVVREIRTLRGNTK